MFADRRPLAIRERGAADGDPLAIIHCDALGDDLAVAIRVGHGDGITLPQIIRTSDLTAGFNARARIQGEGPLPILLARLTPYDHDSFVHRALDRTGDTPSANIRPIGLTRRICRGRDIALLSNRSDGGAPQRQRQNRGDRPTHGYTPRREETVSA